MLEPWRIWARHARKRTMGEEKMKSAMQRGEREFENHDTDTKLY